MRYPFGFLCVCALSAFLLVGCGETVLCEGVVCEDDGNECTTAVCDPATGTCQHTTVEDDTACDFDGLPGLCKAGVCESAMLCEGVVCDDDDNECTDDVCDLATGTCQHITLEDDTACDFGGSPGLCKAGVCVDAMLCEGVECDDANECTSDVCTPLTGTCAHTPVEDGTGCAGGICRAGECGPLCIANVCHCSEAGIRAAIEGGGDYPYRFNCSGPTTVMTEAEIDIDNDVILDGEGNLTVDANESHRVFSVASGVTAELRGMTVTRGAANGNGGGINNTGELALTHTTVSSNRSGSDGGGIWNQGTLTLTECGVTGNTAASSGGGIENFGFTELNRSTVSGNTAMDGGGGAIESGPAELRLINTTVSGNVPTPGRGAIENNGQALVISSTLQQLPVGVESHLWDGSGWAMFRNTILNGECVGWPGVDSYGGNIESPGDTCNLWYWEDQVFVSEAELDLGPLQDNGGPTLTHLPGPGSVAIDRIEPWACEDANWDPLEIDQRGVGRPQGSLCDVGSVEAPSLCGGVDCDDQNECTSDRCNPADASCSHDAVPDGWGCDLGGGGSGGTGGPGYTPGICFEGECIEDFCASYPCDDGNQCTFDHCDSLTRECTNDWVPDGWYCSFGNGGSGGSGGAGGTGGGGTGGVGGTGGSGYMQGICFEGECIENLCAGNPCYDANDCTFDNCDPFTRECTNDPVPDGRYCFLGGGGTGGMGGEVTLLPEPVLLADPANFAAEPPTDSVDEEAGVANGQVTGTCSAECTGPDPVDQWTITPTVAGEYRISLRWTPIGFSDLDLYLVDSGGRLVGFSATPGTTPETIVSTLAAAQQYLIQVQAFETNDETQGYTLEVRSTDGTGGTGGEGGTGGMNGTGVCVAGTCEPLPADCLPTIDRCVNGTIDEHFPCCEQPVPDQANACDGTESVANPMSCTVLENPVTYGLTLMEVEGDCNVGYDIDSCPGQSCFPGGLAPAEGVGGVDNAVAGLAPTLEGVGGNLSGVNQALADTLCGMTDDPSAGSCDGGSNDGGPCTSANDCPGIGGDCNLDDNDCLLEGAPADIRFVVDANPGEGCANVTVLAGGQASAHILNLSDDGCASGTLGTIPLTIGGIDGAFANTVARMTISAEGFSDGALGVTIDENTAVGIAEALLEGGGAVVAQVLDINASTPPTQDTSAACNALSATLQIGGIAQ